MKIAKIISQVEVVGILQYGFRGATTYTLNSFDIASIKSFTDDNTITRDAVCQWIKRRWSDLQKIEDFSVTIGDGEFDEDVAGGCPARFIIRSTWQREESEQVFYDCVYGDIYDIQ